VISPTQRPLSDNTQQSQVTDIHAPGRIQTLNPTSEQMQTHAFDLTATGVGLSGIK